MLNIGCHLSASSGFLHMGKEAIGIHANTFQFFSRNPRGSSVKALDMADVEALLSLTQQKHFAPLLAHAPYTLNACSANPGLRDLARDMMSEDLARMEFLPGNLYNFHPGSHTGQGTEVAIEQISDLLNVILKQEQHTLVLLETMAGKGSEVGSKFEELRAILDRVTLNSHMGVCLDTCHVYSAGYDIVQDLDGVLNEFDRIVGLSRIKAIHLNDSMMPFASHKDRHERIGKGSLGMDAIVNFITHPKLRHLPFYLETPNELEGYAEEIALLQEQYRSRVPDSL